MRLDSDIPKERRAEDHCWLRSDGKDWRIIHMRTLSCVVVMNTYGERYILNLSHVDWPAYCDKAIELMRWQYDF